MDLKIHPPLPRRRDFRIGVIGSGFIVNDCHLVAYRKAGFNPVAIASRTKERAAKVAQQHQIPLRVHNGRWQLARREVAGGDREHPQTPVRQPV